ncbi:hypothetical protein AKJ08_2894 [Vulgatibacter incomptus]|uniref:Uncharacterized protein n=1 Tax=Vulgatibacter incomptus TaxID=1391653 RepID=A0A0K1PG74_9BACT|nr:hypothetical protein AKJ08_2894 [Vulgatibacter incomptus]
MSSSSSPQISCTFFLRTRSAAVSASAFSLRLSSRSSSRTRFASGPTERRAAALPRLATAVARHSSSWALCSPFWRRYEPSSSSLKLAVSIRTCSFSSLVHWRVLLSSRSSILTPSLPASSSQRESVAWAIPDCLASAVADIACGPVSFSTIFALNPSEYGVRPISNLLFAPYLIDLRCHDEATTTLTQGGIQDVKPG